MKKRVIALMLAFVLVLNMGTVAFANGEATPAPVTETEPTPTPAAEATPTPTPAAEATPTPTPVVEETPTPTPAADPTPTSTPAVEATPTPTPTPEVVLVSISVTQKPDKLEYLCSDTVVDSTGGILTLTFSDETTQTVDLSAAALSLVNETVNVTYEGMTDSFAVTIEHSYDEGVITTEATATEPGVMTYTCTNCGDVQTGEIPMAVATEIASGTCGDNLTWSLSEEGVLTISGTGVMDNYGYSSLSSRPWHEYISEIKEIVIQSGVTEIGSYAFRGCSALTSVTIPDSVTSIGGWVFSGCSSLISITIPDSVTSIGSFAFSDCSSLSSITIPDSVTSIGSCAFYDCSSLSSITIPDSVTSIGSSTFSGCSSLSSITIPDSVTSIGSYTFYGCTFTTAGPVGSGCDYEFDWTDRIPSYAFDGCSSLISITIPDSVTSIGDYAFSDCSSLSSITIPDGVTSIGGSAFSGCSSLISITIPDGVTSIGGRAFWECSSLSSITIPDGVTSIDSYTFYGCSSLSSITIPDGVTSIDSYTFYGCSSLGSITIPDSVTSIGNSAFNGCDALNNVHYSGTRSEWNSITIGSSNSALISAVKYYESNGCAVTWEYADGVLTISGNGKMDSYKSDYLSSRPWHKHISEIKEIIIEPGVTDISGSSFSGCSALESITIPFVGGSASDNTYLGYIFGASSYLSNDDSVPASLKSVTVTGGTTIPEKAFYGCNYLESITIPNGVTSIGDYTFRGCSSLSSISIPDSVTSIGKYAFNSCSSLSSITIPDSVTTIGESAFYGCSSLNSITIPDSVTSISDYAFDGCSSLSSITIPNGVTSIGYCAFFDCSSLSSITIPDSVTSISGSAFSRCSSLSSITIPDSVTSIGSSAFYRCSSLSSITIPFVGGSASANTHFGYIFGASSSLYNDDYVPESLKSVTVTGGTTIPEGAFCYCNYLESITIPDSVTSIGSSAFYRCSSLISITIPDGVTSIDSYTFYGCSSLISITIPDSVTSIGGSAFEGCNVLNNVHYSGTQDEWKSITIGSYNSELTGAAKHYECSGCTVTWEYADGILTISGTGRIDNYLDKYVDNYNINSLSSRPWHRYISEIKKIVIQPGITHIGNWAFDGCSSLISITIPASVTEIGYSAFRGCNSLSGITIPFVGGSASANTHFGYIFGANSISSNNNYVPASLKNVTVTGGTTISACAFTGCNYLENITIPNSVTTIGLSAFYDCNSLSGITIPDSVTSIGRSAFNGCSSLSSITIPDGVTSIEPRTFKGCTGLTSIIMPDSVAIIGESAFYGCSGLTNIEIPDGVTSIGDNAFNDCANLTNAAIPGSVNTVGTSVFAGCTGLTTAGPIGSGCAIEYCWEDTIPENAFAGADCLVSIDMPNSITTIRDNAFNGCTSLASVTISDGVTSIGEGAFSGCTGLTDITIPASMIDCNVFDQCTGLTSLTLTKGTGTMPNLRFSEDTDSYYQNTPWYQSRANSINVVIEEGVTNIGDCVFMGCTGLASIELPDSLTSIGSFAFTYCDSLKEVNFPENLKTIGSYAFYFCDGDPTLKFYGDAPKIDDNSFASTTANAYYLHTTQWEESNLQNYGGNITWQLCCDGFTPCEAIADEGKEPTFEEGGMTAGSYCSICSKPVVVQNELPKLEITELEVVMPTKFVYYKNEDFDNTGLQVIAKLNNDTDMDITEQVQLEGFSSNAAGTKTITVSYNDVQTSFDVYVFSFSSVSLSLEGRVILNFYANFPGMAEAGYTPGILFFREQPNASEIIRAYSVEEGINTYAVNDDGTLMFSYDKLAAKELNDKVYATLYVEQSDGNVVFGEPAPISVADYAISAFNLYADEPEFQTLMVDMLNFGAAAQGEFNYRTDALANSNMSAAMAAKATKNNVSLSNGMKLYNDNLSSDKVTIKSASLSLDNEISINFYAEIKGDIKKAELLIFDEYTAGGVYDKTTASKRTDMIPHGDMYAGFIRNIAAKSMRDLYYARVYVQFEDGTEAYSGIGQYSVESYAWQVRNGSGFSSELKLLMEEMMKYGDSAKVYMANKNANANG